MTIELLLMLMLILVVLTYITAFYSGWIYAVNKYNLKSINKYLNTHFPNRWAAYKKGVSEGYEQGLRDGQDNLL